MNKPKTYLDKVGRTNSRYFFVSYSHRDIDAVYPVLAKLFDNGVNYWYDVELDPGDKWNSRVTHIIDDEHCIGALIFLSANSLVSDAVCKEVEYMAKKSPEIRLVPIVIGYSDAKSLLFDVANKDQNFYTTNFDMFKNLTRPGLWTLFDEAVDKITVLAAKDNITDQYLVNTRDSFLNDLDSRTYKGKRSLLCGRYPFDIEEREEDISWLLLERTGEEFLFVSEYCIDFINIEEIPDMLDKLKTQFSDKEYVTDIRPINESVITRNANLNESLPTDYADKHRNQVLRVFWVLKGDGDANEYCLYNSLNVKINEKIDHSSITAGVRLLLTVKNDKIRSN